jgi:signal transduction histidine kinase
LFDRIADERRDERMRIASELHDDVLQSLIRVSQIGSFLRKEVEDHTQAARDASEMLTTSREAISQLRDVVSDLRKSPLVRGGLVPTLRGLVRDLEMDWRVKIELQAASVEGLSAEAQMVLYQTAREGLINALKHADAENLGVRIAWEGEEVRLTVTDDGRGFILGSSDPSLHFGLGLVEERVRLAGGRFSIESGNASGTRLSVWMPINQPNQRPRPVSAQGS